MLDHFIEIIKNSGIRSTDTVLLAISGGVDSMLLWHLCEQAKLRYEVAHVNFCLRGKESDADEALVTEKAKELKVKLHLKKVDTKKSAAERKYSIQMAAREIRYEWFEELLIKNNIGFLATAHHLNDSLETFLINLNRGTGLKGLTGIPSGEKLVRPLLQFSKKEIRAYALVQKIEYREDKSNAKIDYERNWFRHEMITKWEEHNPQLLDKMQLTFKRLQNAQDLLNDFLAEETSVLKQQLAKNELGIVEVLKLKHQKEGLFYLLYPLGFNEIQIDDLLNCIAAKEVGKQFETETFKLFVDREKLFLQKKDEKNNEGEVIIDTTVKSINQPVKMEFKRVEVTEFSVAKDRGKGKEAFDFNKLEFPLRLRKWKSGDWMIPLGMKGKKKVSDMLIDAKVPLHKKNSQYVLCSGQNIVCLLGIRVDERFKITAQSKQVFQIQFKQD